MKPSFKLLLPIVLELLIFGGLLSASFLLPGVQASCQGSNPSSTVRFTIIESDSGPMEGMNGSAHQGANSNWPIIRVSLCETVVIVVKNVNSSEPHGFAIDHYFDTPNGQSLYPGIELLPGQSFNFTFVASEAGTFRMYCSVFCAIHPLMKNGELDVT